MATFGVSKPVTLRDLSDPDDLQCSSSSLTYKKVLLARMKKHVPKYEALPSKSCVSKIVTTDRHTHRQNPIHIKYLAILNKVHALRMHTIGRGI